MDEELKKIEIINKLKTFSKPEKKEFFYKTFKAYPSGYGEGDQFLYVMVPDIRKIAKYYERKISLNFVENFLLNDSYHEVRLLALIILVYKYKSFNKNSKKHSKKFKNDKINIIQEDDNIFKSESFKLKREIFNIYLRNLRYINNWDLVDLSAPYIVGDFLYNYYFKKNDFSYNNILFKIAKSQNLWEARIAIVSTLYFIKNKELETSIQICKILIIHKHDLIHKACGWILREVGKINKQELLKFIYNNYDKISRTTLRYSIEKFSKEERYKLLNFRRTN